MHRKIWESSFGKIPKDEDGRSYEIHHIDGNRKNNDISNLKLVSIKEHYDIHLSQGDYGACSLIGKRMNMSPEEISNLQKGHKRPGIGGVKKGTIPWNKGKSGWYILTNQSKLKRSNASIGAKNSNAKLNEENVRDIITLYLNKPELEGVNSVGKNGVPASYDWVFSKHTSNFYPVSSVAIMRIINKKCWKHVWKEFEI